MPPPLNQAQKDLVNMLRQAEAEGPQFVRDEAGTEAVLLSPDDYRALRRSNAPDDLVTFFETWPSLEEVDLRRERDGAGERTW